MAFWVGGSVERRVSTLPLGCALAGDATRRLPRRKPKREAMLSSERGAVRDSGKTKAPASTAGRLPDEGRAGPRDLRRQGGLLAQPGAAVLPGRRLPGAPADPAPQ